MNQTSNIRTGSLRPDIQAEAEHFQTRSPGSDRSWLDGFSLERISEDIPASGRTSSQQASKLRPDSLEPSIPDGPDTPPWTKQSPDMPPQTRSYQTKHPSSDCTGSASYQTSKVRRSGILFYYKLRSDSFQLRQHSQRRNIQAQAGQPQPQTGHPGSDETDQDQTCHFKAEPCPSGRPGPDWRGTAADQTSQLRPDTPIQTAHAYTGQQSLDSHRLRPDKPPQTAQPQARLPQKLSNGM